MERLIAKRPVLYQGRQYEPGEILPAYDTDMVGAWLRVGTAKMVSDSKLAEATDNTEADNATQSAQDGQDAQDDTEGKQDSGDAENGTQSGQEAVEMVDGSLDPAQLESMSKENLVALAKEMGVELPRGAAKALIVEKLAAVTVQAPASNGSAQ